MNVLKLTDNEKYELEQLLLDVVYEQKLDVLLESKQPNPDFAFVVGEFHDMDILFDILTKVEGL